LYEHVTGLVTELMNISRCKWDVNSTVQ